MVKEEQRIFSMKPEHEARRKLIREWMSLPKDKRQTEEHAESFAKKAMERIPQSRSVPADNEVAVAPHRQNVRIRLCAIVCAVPEFIWGLSDNNVSATLAPQRSCGDAMSVVAL